MTAPPSPSRLLHRAFPRVEFDPAGSDDILEIRGFDRTHAARIFPASVLERRDTRRCPEPRVQVVGECLGEGLFVVYTRRGRRAVGAPHGWRRPSTGSYGMTTCASRTTVVDQSGPDRGRYDPVRIANPLPGTDEQASVVPAEDIEATRVELAELRRRLSRKSA